MSDIEELTAALHHTDMDRLRGEVREDTLRGEVARQVDLKEAADAHRTEVLRDFAAEAEKASRAFEHLRGMAKLLEEAASDIEAYVRREYGADHPDGIHPYYQRKYDADMTLVHDARSAVIGALALIRSHEGVDPPGNR